MDKPFAKLKGKMRRSVDGSGDHSSTINGKDVEHILNKPLPSTPEQGSRRAKPSVRMVNAFADPEQSQQGEKLASTSPHGPDETARPTLVPHFSKLTLEDPIQHVNVTPLAYESMEKRQKTSKRLSSKSIVYASDRSDDEDISQKIQHKIRDERAAITSMIPDRSSSRKDRSLNNASPKSPRQPPSPETAVRRKSLPAYTRLPANFQLADTVDTSVKTTQAPAVTHEVIQHHTEEVIHPEITRDVHVHHYHTVVQPIRQVVVKPAVHYTIGEHGEKVQIPNPEGWQPPASFAPTGEESQDELTQRIMESLESTHKAPWLELPPTLEVRQPEGSTPQSVEG